MSPAPTRLWLLRLRAIPIWSKMRGSSGYAIAEVLVAVVIISISFIELSGAISKIMRSANQTILIGKSISVTHSTMEKVMAQSFDEKGSEAGGYALKFNFEDDGNYVTLDNVYNGIKTISFWLQVDNIGALRTDYIFDFDGAKYIKISNSTLSSNVTAPTYYINADSDVTTIGAINTWYHVVITTNSGINVSALKIGKLEGDVNGLSGIIDEVQFWSTVKDPKQIKNGVTNPYNTTELKLYLRMNNGIGRIAFDHSSNSKHCTITGLDMWVDQSSSWSTTLGTEGEDSWSDYDDVDDFHTISFTDTDYSQLGGRIYVKYVVVDPTSWAISDAGEGIITDYKQITVKVGTPGSTDSTQLNAIKSAKIIQNYGLTYSPYGN